MVVVIRISWILGPLSPLRMARVLLAYCSWGNKPPGATKRHKLVACVVGWWSSVAQERSETPGPDGDVAKLRVRAGILDSCHNCASGIGDGRDTSARRRYGTRCRRIGGNCPCFAAAHGACGRACGRKVLGWDGHPVARVLEGATSEIRYQRTVVGQIHASVAHFFVDSHLLEIFMHAHLNCSHDTGKVDTGLVV